MIKAFFTDLDGTLLSETSAHDKYIPDSNIAALKRLQSTGVKIITASGRNLEYTQNNINQAYGFDFDVIASNGGLVVCQHQVIGYYSCDKQKIYELAKFLHNEKNIVPFIVNANNEHYFTKANQGLYDEFKSASDKGQFGFVYELASLEDILCEDFMDPIKMCIQTTSYAETLKWEQQLQQKYEGDFEIYNSTDRFIEVMPKGVHKGMGIIQICHQLAIDLSDISVIGDAANDVFMFRLTPYSFVMDHAKDSVKSMANYVVKDVAQAIDWIIEENMRLAEKENTI